MHRLKKIAIVVCILPTLVCAAENRSQTAPTTIKTSHLIAVAVGSFAVGIIIYRLIKQERVLSQLQQDRDALKIALRHRGWQVGEDAPLVAIIQAILERLSRNRDIGSIGFRLSNEH